MAPDLPETCTQYSVARDRYGDLVLTEVGSLACLFRDTSSLLTDVSHREELNIQGTFWFAHDATVKQGDVIKYGGQLYRLEGITNAKDLLMTDTVQFIKAQASFYRAIS